MRLLKEHKVAFVIIGATAFPVHGYARATLDIDIFICPENSNAQKVWAALKEFGYDLSDVSVEDLLNKKLLIRQYDVETDIHPFVRGLTFNRVWKNKVRAKLGNTFVYFAALKDLIKMKQTAARPQDLADLQFLRRLGRRRKSNKNFKP